MPPSQPPPHSRPCAGAQQLRLAGLPTETLADILTARYTCPPTCALALFCPDWALCRRAHLRLEAVLRTTRVDTYVLPSLPTHLRSSRSSTSSTSEKEVEEKEQEQEKAGGGGKVTTTFDHPPDEHARFSAVAPVMRDPRGLGMVPGRRGGFPPFLHRELVRAWVSKSVVVLGQRLGSGVGPLWGGLEPEEVERMVLLRDVTVPGEVEFERTEEGEVIERRGVGGVVPFEDDFWVADGGDDSGETVGRWRVFGIEGWEKEVLPPVPGGDDEGNGAPRYLYQRLRHLVVNTVPALTRLEATDLGMAPSTWNADASSNLVHLEERLEYERRANLLLRWDAMEQLESLFLDLRGYSMPTGRYLFDEDILDLATSLAGKGLGLLVVAGLRSWTRYCGPEPLHLDEVEGGTWKAEWGVWVDENRGGRINWWRSFIAAVKPGGRLVFVDKGAGDGTPWRLLRPDSLHRAMMY